MEQCRLFHGIHHFLETAGWYGECQLVFGHQWTCRGVQHAEEAAAASLGVLLAGEGHDTTTARAELGANGIIGIVVVERPRAETGQYVGRGEEKNALHALQAIQLVQSREVKVGLLGQLDVQSVYIFPYLPWGLLVVLHFRDEHRHTFGHGGKSGVKAASAAQHVLGRQCQWLSVAYLTYGTYHAAGYFPCFFHRFVAVAKGDGQGNAFPESFPVFHDKLFNAHNDCMMFKDSLFAAASFRLHAFTTLT